jgi:glycosyltransferase involved in cell wall biosynthesis
MRRSLGPYVVDGRKFHRDNLRSWLYRQVTMRARSALDRIAIGLTDQVSFISRSAATDVLGAEAAIHASVVYNGVPPLKPETAGAAPNTDLLFVGANTERKRVELLPLTLAEVRRKKTDATLRIVGFDRQENPEVVLLARELGVLEAIEFTGKVSSGALGQYYRSARVLLVPSRYEGLPMVILEAMQHGLPVVATRVSGHPEVIEDQLNGLLVPVDNPVAMANAALRLLADQELANRFGVAGRSIVDDRFAVDQQISAYVAIYERLAEKKHF